MSYLNATEAGRVSTCPQTAPPSHSETLNSDELINRCMGNIDLVHRVLRKFQQRLPEELAEMTKALECGDVERIARIAHRIKGASVSISAPGIAQVAAEIEDLSRLGGTGLISEHIERLRGAWENCRKEAAPLLSASGAA